MRKLVIATDGSAHAADAVELGLELAAEQGAVPVFVHVVPAFDVLPAGGIAPTGAVPHKVGDEDYDPLVDARRAAEAAGIDAETKLLVGQVADEIVAYADSIDAGMIIVGSRGHGGFKSAVLGSTSRSVLHEARRPVLVARGAHARREAVPA